MDSKRSRASFGGRAVRVTEAQSSWWICTSDRTTYFLGGCAALAASAVRVPSAIVLATDIAQMRMSRRNLSEIIAILRAEGGTANDGAGSDGPALLSRSNRCSLSPTRLCD